MRRRWRWWLRAAGLLVTAGLVAALASAALPDRSPHHPSRSTGSSGSGVTFRLSNVNGPGGVARRVTVGPEGPAAPVVGHWDRSGSDTVGVSVAEGTTRRWVLRSDGATPHTPAGRDVRWGDAGCVPVAGNWQGAGDTIGQACKEHASGRWRWTLASRLTGPGVGTFRSYRFGDASCTPVVGDWNGDGVTTAGVSCPNGTGRTWTLTDSPGDGRRDPEPTASFDWGGAACVPVTGDWDGQSTNRADGTTVGQACLGGSGDAWEWKLSNHNRSGGTDADFSWGSSKQIPTAGDWDGRAGARHTDADTPGTVAGDTGTPVNAPQPNAAGPAETNDGWTPRARYVVDQIKGRFDVDSCGGQADGSDSGHASTSDHYNGNAADCFPHFPGDVSTGDSLKLGDAVAGWVVRYGGLLQVKYVIWNGKIYDFESNNPSWQPYCSKSLTAEQCAHPTEGEVATLQHLDHVHISVRH